MCVRGAQCVGRFVGMMGCDPDVFKTDQFHVEEYSVNCSKRTGKFSGSLI